jgi:hypothetical protein
MGPAAGGGEALRAVGEGRAGRKGKAIPACGSRRGARTGGRGREPGGRGPQGVARALDQANFCGAITHQKRTAYLWLWPVLEAQFLDFF